ncbi:MAG: hypothetical protein A2Y92_04925 [Chloroflexi bacterium RBG_13_57_8]|nr:MAG: hypothetical protein A2Y92_04925 [Chloroflexi bacterium RBG_13_57_8]
MTVLIFIKDLLLATLGQMVSLLAGLFIFGLLIQFISQLTFKSLERSFGSKGVYLIAWLGTPIHELGHALFCVIFGHRIADISLFRPDPVTGTLGYVYHKWNPKNPWHVLGNFFIGVGPMVLGCGVLFTLFYFLLPGSSGTWDAIGQSVDAVSRDSPVAGYFRVFGDTTLAIIKLIFTVDNLSLWRFWLFLYLSICVSGNIRLSWADFKGSLSGLGCIVLPFLLLNLVLLLIDYRGDGLIPLAAASLGAIYSVLLLALIMALIGFVLVYLVAATWYRLRYKLILNPFTLFR